MKKTTCEYVSFASIHGDGYPDAPNAINAVIAKYENAGWEFEQAIQPSNHYGTILFFSKEIN